MGGGEGGELQASRAADQTQLDATGNSIGLLQRFESLHIHSLILLC